MQKQIGLNSGHGEEPEKRFFGKFVYQVPGNIEDESTALLQKKMV